MKCKRASVIDVQSWYFYSIFQGQQGVDGDCDVTLTALVGYVQVMHSILYNIYVTARAHFQELRSSVINTQNTYISLFGCFVVKFGSG